MSFHFFLQAIFILIPMNKNLLELTANIYIKYGAASFNDKEHNIESKHCSFYSTSIVFTSQS
jgi:hypothetical protein